VYRQAGIDGYSVFFIDPATVRERLAELDHVYDARVRVRLPARVSIELTERQPTILYQIQGNSWWIDDEGVIMPITEEKEGLIGLFMNALVIRAELHGHMSFSQLLTGVRASCLDAYAHQDVPFEQIAEALQPDRNLSLPLWYQVMHYNEYNNT